MTFSSNVHLCVPLINLSFLIYSTLVGSFYFVPIMAGYTSYLSYIDEGTALCLLSTRYLVAAVIDKNVPLPQDLESSLKAAWKLHKPFCINSLANNHFLIYFQSEHDRRFILENAPWVVKNTFIPIKSPAMFLSNGNIDVYPLWVQFIGLPNDFHNADVAEKLGNIVGDAMFDEDQQVIFEESALYLKVRVKVDTTLPLIQKIKFVRADNGNDGWIYCIYERVHRRCRKKCGRIGHVSRECKWNRDSISEALKNLKDKIGARFGEDIEIGTIDEAPGDTRDNAIKHTADIHWSHGPTGIQYQVFEKPSSGRSYGEKISNMIYQSDCPGSTPSSANENDAVAVTYQIYNQVHSQHHTLPAWMAGGSWSQDEDIGASNPINFYHGYMQEMIQPNYTLDPIAFPDQNLVAANNYQQALMTQEFNEPRVDENNYKIPGGLFNQDASGSCWHW